jgi:probable rRNA maturation factor
VRGLPARIRKASSLALARGARTPQVAPLTILLSGAGRVRALHRRYRGQDKPTNVLAFPAGPNGENYLGDVALAAGVAAREAREGGKTFVDHATHLAVHGVLHLLGYDHEKPRAARQMERLETEILSSLGISDPYKTRPKSA